jgi:hypothetical protein
MHEVEKKIGFMILVQQEKRRKDNFALVILVNHMCKLCGPTCNFIKSQTSPL